MKRIALVFLLIFCFFGLGIASDDADRMVTSRISSGDVTSVKTTAGQVYKVSMIATSSNGWVAVYDSSSSSISGKKPLIEIREATQYVTAKDDWPQGLNFYNGIQVERSNADIIIYYY